MVSGYLGLQDVSRTAGALKALCEAGIVDEFEIVTMSGTSGGAVCAVLVWHALERGEDPPCRRLMNFWQDNSAKGWAEIAFNQFLVEGKGAAYL